MSRTVMVYVYESLDRTSLLDIVPIIDPGVVTDDGLQPTNEVDLIDIAKSRLRAQRRASDNAIERFHYELERPQVSP